jgi:hypothetical protein
MINLFDNPTLDKDNNYYILTNNNVGMEYLSRYLIMPEGMIQKYFKDLLEICPGRIPVFKTIPKENLLEYSTLQDPDTLYPVVFELSLSESNLSKISNSEIDGSEQVFFPEGVISIANINRILFRTNDEISRFKRFVETQVSNISLEDYKLDIISETDGLNDPVALKSQAEKLDTGNNVNEELLVRENKISGALLINRLIFNLEKSDSILKGILGGIEHTLVKLSLSAGIIATSEWAKTNFRKSADGDHDVETPEGLIFSVLVQILSDLSPKTGFSTDELMESLLEIASKPLAKNEYKKLKDDLDNISDFLIGTKKYGDVYKQCNFTMTRVLLFFTRYHSQLDEFIQVEPKDKTNHKELQFLTGFLLGYYYGLDMLPLKYKEPRLDRFIANSFAYHLNNSLGESIKPILDVDKLREEYDNSVVELPIRAQLLIYFKGSNFDDPDVIGKAIRVAEELDIKECIKTIITPMGKDDDDFRISQTKKGTRKVLQIIIPGVADVEHKVSEKEFIERIESIEIKGKKENKVREIIS